MRDILDELRQLLSGYLAARGLDLIEVIYRDAGRNTLLRILVDRPYGGISIQECAKLNHQISALLEEKDIIRDSYILEVSSPGLDRPLKSQKDFLRCIGRNVRFFLNEPVQGKIELTGILKQAKEESVEIETAGGTAEIAFSKILKATQVIE